jgi:hypothetical protein
MSNNKTKANNEVEGCVYYTFNEYINKSKKDKIHKIVKRDFLIENELTNQAKLKNIINNERHFYLCETSKDLHITIFDEETNKIKGKNIKKDDTILLEFEDQNLIYFKTYLKNLDNPTLYIASIIDTYKYLLSSIQLLVDANIFHNHINFDTIVINNKETPLLSNFMFSMNISHKDIQQYIKHFIIAYEPSYTEWSIELHILSYLLTNKLDSLSNYNVENIIHEYIDNNNILKTFGDTIVSSYRTEAQQYFKKYINKSYDFIVTDILKHSNTWDNYALSILFLRILIGIHKTIEIKNKFIIFFMKLLVCNINLNPCKRLSISDTYKQFNLLLNSLEPKDYKEVINRLISS